MNEFPALITRVVNAHNATVYAMANDEEWHGHHDEFEAAIQDLRRADRVRSAAALHRIPSPDPDHVVPTNASIGTFDTSHVTPINQPPGQLTAPAAGGEGSPSIVGIDTSQVDWTKVVPQPLPANDLAQEEIIDGHRWRPTADYRLHPSRYYLERLWMCVDDAGRATTWRRVP